MRSSVLEEDMALSVTDDKDEEDENMDDGGHSSTDQDDSVGQSGPVFVHREAALNAHEAGCTITYELHSAL